MLRGLFVNTSCPKEPTSQFYRVWPHDLDAFLHMNNGRYSQIMDVARVDWMMRKGILKHIKTNRWGAVLGGTMVRFNSALKLFQRYKVHTALSHWDEKWFYFEHKFESLEGKVMAVGVTRAGLIKKGKFINTALVVEMVDASLEIPLKPKSLDDWMIADGQLHSESMQSQFNGVKLYGTQ
jgi:acyl-CoA thioesterase FadM